MLYHNTSTDMPAIIESSDRYREIFKGFDFTKLAVLDNFIEKLVFNKVTKPYWREAVGKGAFFALPVQTGIGKTYTMACMIIRELLYDIGRHIDDCKHERRTIVYITNSIDNVSETLNDVKVFIANDELKLGLTELQKDSLIEELLQLEGKSDQLISCDDKALYVIAKAYGVDKQLRQYEHDLKEVRSGAYLSRSHLKAYYTDRMHSLNALLLREIQNKAPDIKKCEGLTYSFLDALDLYLPGERFYRKDAHVLFMSTMKYMYGFDHSHGKCHISGRNQYNQLLIIDEADRQNEEILKHLSKIKAADRVFTLKNIYLHLQGHKLEQTEQYKEIQSAFDDFYNELREYYKQWQLNFAFKLSPTDMPKRLSLFVDRSYFAHRNSADGRLTVKVDNEIFKNVVFVDKSTNNDILRNEDNHLTQLVNQTDHLYRRLLEVMWNAVNLFKKYREENNIPFDAAKITFTALDSILTHYSLPEVVRTEIRDAMKVPPNKYGELSDRYEYHPSGFRFIHYEPDGYAEDTVGGKHYDLPFSPTGVIEQWVRNGTIVLAVSATATADTCIHNFDMVYLKRSLKSQFIELSLSEKEQLNDYYHTLRNYDKRVKIDVKFINDNTFALEDWFIAYQRAHGVQVPGTPNVVGELSEGTETDGDVGHIKAWMSKLLEAVLKFSENSTQRYMVAMLPRHLDGTYAKYLEFLKEVAESKNCLPQRKISFYCVKAADLKAGIKDVVTSELKKAGGARVIIFTTYASLGAGSNFQYPIADDELSLLINTSDSVNVNTSKTDIDCMYLEKPKHMLLSGSDENGEQSPKLVLFHQAMSLLERNQITRYDARNKWLKEIFALNEVTGSKRLLQAYHKTDDYISSVIKYLEQAVGRSARTCMKRPTILLMLDHDLAEIVSNDTRDLDRALVSHEYRAIAETAKEITCKIKSSDSADAIARENNTQRGDLWITEMINSFPKAPSLLLRRGAPRTVEWTELRKTLLREPTVSSDATTTARKIYIPMPKAASRYKFSGNTDGLAKISFFTGNKEVSSEAARLNVLMKNPIIRKHFEDNEYATQWEPQDFIMNPHMFQRIYSAAVGEEAVKAILQHLDWGTQDLPSHVYETYDCIARKQGHANVLVDAKNWSSFTIKNPIENGELNYLQQKSAAVIEVLNTGEEQYGKVLYVNVVGSAEYADVSFMDGDFKNLENPMQLNSSIACVGALVDENTGDINYAAINKLKNWLEY